MIFVKLIITYCVIGGFSALLATVPYDSTPRFTFVSVFIWPILGVLLLIDTLILLGRSIRNNKAPDEAYYLTGAIKDWVDGWGEEKEEEVTPPVMSVTHPSPPLPDNSHNEVNCRLCPRIVSFTEYEDDEYRVNWLFNGGWVMTNGELLICNICIAEVKEIGNENT